MKKLYFLLYTFCLLLCAQLSYASHCAGGELLYKWVSDSTYDITFKLYRDCSGNTAPNNVSMCYLSTCDNSLQSITLLPPAFLPGGQPNGSSVSTGCGGYPSKCESTSSTLPGYAEWWYTGRVTLPHRCAEWQFSVSISARNGSTNLTGGTGNDFYIQSTLNNVVAQGNSSPSFTVRPVPFVCINSPYTYNNGAQDADGDSLAYEMLSPQKGSCGGPGTNINFSSAIYNTTTNPFATGNTFVLDAHNGQMSFTPNNTGSSTLTLRVKEYRNHVLIGTATRDIQVQVLVCSSVQPVITADSFSVTGGNLVNGRIENCANTPMSFCFKVKSTSSIAILVASDNHAAVAPGSSVNYTGQGTDSIRGCFSWTPSALDTGLRTFAVTVKDSTCLPPGIAVSQTYVLPIYIYSVTSIAKDTTICAGQSTPLVVTGGTAFNWTVLPGGSPLTSLSCNNCATPIATPAVTTRYVVTSNLTSICNQNKDTVTVTVTTLPASPSVSATAAICVGDSLRLTTTSNASSYTWTGPAGFNSSLRNPVIANAQVPNTGTYTLIVKNGRCSSTPTTVNVTVAATPRMPTITGDTIVCEGAPVALTAFSNGGPIYRWTGPNGFTAGTPSINLPVASTTIAGTYIVKAYLGNSLSCPSIARIVEVAVTPKPIADFSISKNPVCENEDVIITATGSAAATNQYTWHFDYGSILKSGTAGGPYTIAYMNKGNRKISMRLDNLGCIDSIVKEIAVQPTPSSEFSIQQNGCLNQKIWLNSNERVDFDLAYNWDFQGATVVDGSGKGPYNISFSTPGYKVIKFSTASTVCASAVTTDTIYIHETPAGKIQAVSQNDICAADKVLFIATTNNPAYTYKWSPETYFHSYGSQAEGTVVTSGYVYLNVVDSFGCVGADSIMMNTKPCCEVALPDAFTPNNDGRNDIFRMITVGNQTATQLRVLNRWGQTIFTSGDKSNGWDGTFNDKPLDAGTYFYYLSYKCANGQQFEKKGEVTLIR